MMHKEHLQNFIQKFFKKKTVVKDQQLMHPEREWVIGLSVALLIFIGSGCLSVYSYIKNRAITVSVPPGEEAAVVYRESVVKDALTILEKRAKTYDQLTDNRTAIPEIETDVATSSEEITSEESLKTDESTATSTGE